MIKKSTAILLILLFFAFPALAQSGPAVYDYAAIVGSEVPALNSEIALLEKDTTAELMVVTVNSLEGQTVDAYAYDLFNNWGIGKKGQNNGVLFLVAPNERRARIEVGYGLEPYLTDSICGQILDEYAIPQFKLGNYKGGVVDTTRAIIKILRQDPAAAKGHLGSTPWYDLSQSDRTKFLSILVFAFAFAFLIAGSYFAKRNSYGTWPFVFWLLILSGLTIALVYNYLETMVNKPTLYLGGSLTTLIGGLIYNFLQFRRYKKHFCTKCGSQMSLFDENQDDQELLTAQIKEEQLGSVDYDIWFCPGCLSKKSERYVTFFSGYMNCPKCCARTYKEKSVVLIPATTVSTGTRRVDGLCANCNYTSTRTEVIPRVQESSSSSSSGGGGGGGSSGGGSSGGGGSSRGW